MDSGRGCSGLYETIRDIVVGQMSHAVQKDKEVLNRLESTAERVARGDAHRAHLRRPVAKYLARALIPSDVGTAKSLGRVSLGRQHEHKPGIVIFIPEGQVNLDELERLSRAYIFSPPDGEMYTNIETGEYRSGKRVATMLVSLASEEPDVATDVGMGDDGRICNHVLPIVICACELLSHVYVRWRGPGSEGRIQIDETLEGVRGFVAWIPPSCLPDYAQPEDVARFCGADRRGGQSIPLDELDI